MLATTLSRRLSRSPSRRTAVGVLAVSTLGAALLGAAPASADSGGPAATTSVVVTRLSVADGQGWLTLQARLGDHDSTGFEVEIPAGDGSWSGRAEVYVADLDAHCRLQAGPDLHYVCAPTDPAARLPGGGYQVTIPVTRTGDVTGLTGSTWVDAPTGDGETGSYSSDTFPVYDDLHPRSTAEVRTAPVTPDPDSQGGAATVAVTTTVVPKDSVSALDVALPPGGWRITGSNTRTHDVRCSLLAAGTATGTATPSVHCVPMAAAGGAFPAGRYQLVLRLVFTGDTELATSQVALTTSAAGPEAQDTFDWTYTDLS